MRTRECGGSAAPPPAQLTYAPSACHALQVDIALRHVTHALLAGHDEAAQGFTTGLDAPTAAKTLGYLRDRISVPRDMSYPAARTLRAHLNWGIDEISRAGSAA